MSLKQRSSKGRGLNVDERQLIVAVKASRTIPRIALVWALTHVVQPGDCLKLLVVVPVSSSSKGLCFFCIIVSLCFSCTI